MENLLTRLITRRVQNEGSFNWPLVIIQSACRASASLEWSIIGSWADIKRLKVDLEKRQYDFTI